MVHLQLIYTPLLSLTEQEKSIGQINEHIMSSSKNYQADVVKEGSKFIDKRVSGCEREGAVRSGSLGYLKYPHPHPHTAHSFVNKFASLFHDIRLVIFG